LGVDIKFYGTCIAHVYILIVFISGQYSNIGLYSNGVGAFFHFILSFIYKMQCTGTRHEPVHLVQYANAINTLHHSHASHKMCSQLHRMPVNTRKQDAVLCIAVPLRHASSSYFFRQTICHIAGFAWLECSFWSCHSCDRMCIEMEYLNFEVLQSTDFI